MPILTRDGIDLYYEVDGSGPPLLLVAGLASDLLGWTPVRNALAKRCRLILIDNRGAGRTRPQDAPMSIADMADDCMALLRHLGIAKAHVLGHSMGGFAAQQCALRYPDMVDRLILAASSAANSKRNDAMFADWAAQFANGADLKLWIRNFFYWIFTSRFFENEQLFAAALELALAYPYPQSPRDFANQVRAIAAYDAPGDLAAIRARTLVMAGREDLLFPLAESEHFAKRLPNATFSVIDNAAHSIWIEQPAAFAACVLEFLFSSD